MVTRQPANDRAGRASYRRLESAFKAFFYLTDLSDHAVEIICAPVPAPDSFSLNRAVNVIAAASFAHDYKILLDMFTPHPHGGTTC